MKTDDLIAMLSTNVERVDTRQVSRKIGMAVAAGAAAAIVAVFRLVYYVVPWTMASLVLLSWATGRTARRIESCRRCGSVAGSVVVVLTICEQLYAAAANIVRRELQVVRQLAFETEVVLIGERIDERVDGALHRRGGTKDGRDGADER